MSGVPINGQKAMKENMHFIDIDFAVDLQCWTL